MDGTPSLDSRPPDLQPGTVLNERYRVASVLKSSEQGGTYVAVTESDRTPVVLKEFIVAGQDKLEERAERLYDALEYLETRHHPNIVRVLDMFSANGRAYAVFEFVAGDTMLDWCAHERVKLTHGARR